MFESLELFTAKSGPGVINQLYAFQDKGERDLTLRPELTAPVMRMVAEEMRMDTKPLRLSYYGQCYRYEEFKTGRYREFFQYGVELIGASGPLAEAEVLALAVNMLHASGLEGWEIRIGHVGVLKDALTGLGLSGEVDEATGEPPVASAMRLLDKGDDAGLAELFSTHGLDPANAEPLRALASLDGGMETLGPARELLSSMDGVALDALDELETTLTALAALAPAPPRLAVDLTVARGLDYYTGMVFEVMVEELGGEGQVLGGGSYKLLHMFGLPDLDPCCGFGLGFDRVLLALESQAEASGRDEAVPGEVDARPYIAVAPNKADQAPLLPLVASLREQGARVELLLSKKNYGRIIKWTEGIGASHLLVVKPEDLENGMGRLINFKTGDRADVELTVSSVLDAL
ncbi:MAG TPA: histidine--tRNA ligase family protein [Candidatus Poseidoniales archaeon]|nr:MAG TPA: histidine--tRNA ligase family protein [Candidatus Poseidoniales archaeon]